VLRLVRTARGVARAPTCGLLLRQQLRVERVQQRRVCARVRLLGRQCEPHLNARVDRWRQDARQRAQAVAQHEPAVQQP
jgi:hypothetical protein